VESYNKKRDMKVKWGFIGIWKIIRGGGKRGKRA
jgi:hypothetical protein